MANDLAIRPFSVDEYHELFRAGIFDPDERTELLDGLLVTMPPIGDAHIFTHAKVVAYLNEALADLAIVAGQASLPFRPASLASPASFSPADRIERRSR